MQTCRNNAATHNDSDSQGTPTSRLLEFSRHQRSSTEYEEFLLSIFGILVDAGRWRKASGLAGGWDPATVFVEDSDALRFGNAWKTFLSSPRPTTVDDNCDRATFLGCVLFFLENQAERAAQALATVGFRYRETRREVLLRLATCIFFVARMEMKKAHRVEQVRAMFEEALALCSLDLIETLQPARQRISWGQRGVSLLLLARKDNEPTARVRLQQSVEALALARKLGDESDEHYEYELEALNRLFLASNEVQFLHKAVSLRNGLAQRVERSSGLAVVGGDVHVAQGLLCGAEHNDQEAFTHLNQAVRLFHAALQMTTDSREPIQMRLARSQLKIYFLGHKLGIISDEDTKLDEAIQSFQRAGALTRAADSPYATALLFKADLLKKQRRLDEAMSLIDEALLVPVTEESPPNALGVKHSLELLRSACLIRMGAAVMDCQQVRDALRSHLEAASPEDIYVAEVAEAGRVLLDNASDAESRELVSRAVHGIEASIDSGKHVGDALRFVASNAATLLLKLHGDEDVEVVRKAHRLLRVALEAVEVTPAAELFGRLADTSFTLAKVHLQNGEKTEGLSLLDDACDFHSAGIEEAEKGDATVFNAAVAHSKLSVVFLARQSITGDLHDAESAIRHMEIAMESGITLPQRFGHLGDAHYRLGRARGDSDMLRLAVEFKRLARGGPDADLSRENRSVTAAILLRLWQSEQDPTHISEAINEIELANRADPAWPWPFFQLADAIEQVQQHGLSAEGISKEAERFIDEVQWSPARARARACELAVRTTEFVRRWLGGQRRNAVHVLADPHHLLAQTVVLKRITSPRALAAETQAIARLAATLKARQAPVRFRYPQHVAVVSDDTGDRWHATKFEKGVDLGRLIYYSAKSSREERPRIDEILHDTTRFLALFHASGEMLASEHASYKQHLDRFWADDIRRVIGPLSHNVVSITTKLSEMVPFGIPLCQKKDPHTGNWLVTPSGDIVMIDFESTRYLPVLYELAELLEDYPAIPITEDGKQRRADLVRSYLTEISSANFDDGQQFNQENLNRAYFAFVMVWAVAGLRRIMGQSVEVSGSTLRASEQRERHYRDLLLAFAQGWGDGALVPIARSVLSGIEAT